MAVSVSLAAVAWWIAAGDRLNEVLASVGLTSEYTSAAIDEPDGVPVRIDSRPTGAELRIDGLQHAQTPALLSLPSGVHAIALRRPEFVEFDQRVQIPPDGATLSIDLWRRSPDVIPLRPVQPGSTLVDAHFDAAGDLALTFSTPASASLIGSRPAEEGWLLDPATGALTRIAARTDPHTLVQPVAVSPDGKQVAFATEQQGIATQLRSSASGPQPKPTSVEALATVEVSGSDGTGPRTLWSLPRADTVPAAAPERISELVWTPDGTRLVVVTRAEGSPARSRLTLLAVAPGAGTADSRPSSSELALMPAEIPRRSATIDPTGRWLAFLAHPTTSTTTTAGNVSVCILELKPGGTLRDVADAGPLQRLPAVPALAWAPPSDNTPARLLFSAPVAESTSNAGSNLLDIFGALKPADPATGLFVIDVDGAGGPTRQPRRVGTLVNLLAPVWRDPSTINGLTRRDDGSLALTAVDEDSGRTWDTGARILSGVVRGSGLGARWDVKHGRALLVTRAGPNTSTHSRALQAWVIDFVARTAGHP